MVAKNADILRLSHAINNHLRSMPNQATTARYWLNSTPDVLVGVAHLQLRLTSEIARVRSKKIRSRHSFQHTRLIKWRDRQLFLCASKTIWKRFWIVARWGWTARFSSSLPTCLMVPNWLICHSFSHNAKTKRSYCRATPHWVTMMLALAWAVD